MSDQRQHGGPASSQAGFKEGNQAEGFSAERGGEAAAVCGGVPAGESTEEAVSSASYQQAANLMKPGHVLTPSLNGLNANSSPSKRLVPAVQCARCTHRVQGSSPSDRQPSSPAAAPRLTEKQPPEKQRNSLQTNTEKQPPEKQPPTACSPKTHGKLAPGYSVVPAYCRYYGNAIKAPTNERN